MLDLLILQVDGGAAPQEADDGHEPIAGAAADDRADDPRQRAANDADADADGVGRLDGHGQARGEHPIDLEEVALQDRLLGDRQDVDQRAAAECRRRAEGKLILLDDGRPHSAEFGRFFG